MSIFGSSLEICLQQLGKPQSWLAEAAGVTPASISQYISGTREPNHQTMLKMCAALKTTPNDLLGFHSGERRNLQIEIQRLRNKLKSIGEILED